MRGRDFLFCGHARKKTNMTKVEIQNLITEATGWTDKVNAIIAEARTAGRDLTQDERERAEAALAKARRIAERVEAATSPGIPQSRLASVRETDKKFLTREDRFANALHDPTGARPGDLSLGKICRGLAIGDWHDAAEERDALAGSPNSAGGYLLPVSVAGSIIDFARSSAVCVQAGAVSIPMDGKTTIPVLASDPAGVWHAENQSEDDSGVAFEGRALIPHTAFCSLRGSVELFEDAAMLDVALTRALRGSLGLQLDRAALMSDGSGGLSPTGILHTDGVTVEAASPSAISYDLISRGAEVVAQNNGTANAAVLCPRDFYALDRAVASGGDEQTKIPFSSYSRLAKFVTNSIELTGSPATDSQVYVGDFGQMVFGVRTDWRIEMTRQETTAWKSLQIALRIYGRFDVALLQPAHFYVATAVTAS